MILGMACRETWPWLIMEESWILFMRVPHLPIRVVTSYKRDIVFFKRKYFTSRSLLVGDVEKNKLQIFQGQSHQKKSKSRI